MLDFWFELSSPEDEATVYIASVTHAFGSRNRWTSGIRARRYTAVFALPRDWREGLAAFLEKRKPSWE